MKTYPDIPSLRSALSGHMKRQNLTQLDVSRATGVPQSAISMLLGEKRGLNGDSALKIHDFIMKAQYLPADDAAPPSTPSPSSEA
jgi:predicted transcriptional regulator